MSLSPSDNDSDQGSKENILYIQNLSFRTKEKDLEKIFSKFGNISRCTIITSSVSGKSRGFGFVTFENSEDAKVAKNALDNTEIDERKIRVENARKSKDNRSSPRRSEERYRERYQNGNRERENFRKSVSCSPINDGPYREYEECNLYVQNLNFRTKEEDLEKIFGKYGKIKICKVIKDHISGRSKGYGFVTFENLENAEAAKNALDNTEVDERRISIENAKKPGVFGSRSRRSRERGQYKKYDDYRDRDRDRDRYSNQYRDRGRNGTNSRRSPRRDRRSPRKPYRSDSYMRSPESSRRRYRRSYS
ncbi:hypothetical protein SteCoe_5455 [Stentor coeruleus]|uniref:RRM domain-containing protein n=1 Tax=Stentor coeruleus TaxID=5963 RepID=A0A1R2CSA3_9CILI|nr:hypothetical protein SteCoe_5455 [Stentor coeruleus]